MTTTSQSSTSHIDLTLPVEGDLSFEASQQATNSIMLMSCDSFYSPPHCYASTEPNKSLIANLFGRLTCHSTEVHEEPAEIRYSPTPLYTTRSSSENKTRKHWFEHARHISSMNSMDTAKSYETCTTVCSQDDDDDNNSLQSAEASSIVQVHRVTTTSSPTGTLEKTFSFDEEDQQTTTRDLVMHTEEAEDRRIRVASILRL